MKRKNERVTVALLRKIPNIEAELNANLDSMSAIHQRQKLQSAVKKTMLIEMARRGDPKPTSGPMHHALRSYTRSGSPSYDSKFTQEIRCIRPDWFQAKEKPLTAFGETKTVAAWTRDERCRVNAAAIVRRTAKGMNAEQAISMPNPRASYHTAFGKTKRLSEWARDTRCRVGLQALHRRMKTGWNFSTALTTPLTRNPQMITAFGETKRQREWVHDSRCVVPRSTFDNRIAQGWKPEVAMTTPSTSNEIPLEAFGESKGIVKWSKDPRCVVSLNPLKERLKKGWTLEAAMMTPAARGNRKVRCYVATSAAQR